MKTFSKEKNEILFSQFNVNYNFLPETYKKGTTLFRSNFGFEMMSETVKSKKDLKNKNKKKCNKDKDKNYVFKNEEKKIKEENLNKDLINLKINEDENDKEIKNKELLEDDNHKINNNYNNNENSSKDNLVNKENEKFKNPMYQFSFSENFHEIYKGFKAKNIEITNEDIIKDDFWLRNSFVFNKSEENFE